MKTLLGLLFIVTIISISGCKDNITSPDTYNTVYQRDGLLDSIVGNCSAIVTRDYYIDTLDMRSVSKVKVDFDGLTDADISFFYIYYVDAGTSVKLLEVIGSDAISNTKSFIVDSPHVKKYYYIRLGLNSSVCTGDLFSLRLRDIKISFQ